MPLLGLPVPLSSRTDPTLGAIRPQGKGAPHVFPAGVIAVAGVALLALAFLGHAQSAWNAAHLSALPTAAGVVWGSDRTTLAPRRVFPKLAALHPALPDGDFASRQPLREAPSAPSPAAASRLLPASPHFWPWATAATSALVLLGTMRAIFHHLTKTPFFSSQWCVASIGDPEVTEAASITHSATSTTVPEETTAAWAYRGSRQALLSAAALVAVLSVTASPLPTAVPNLALPFFLAAAPLTVFIGSHRALEAPLSNTINFDEAKLLPLGAALALLTLYVVITLFPNFDLATFIGGYFALLGTVGVTFFLSGPLQSLAHAAGVPLPRYTVPLPGALFKENDGGRTPVTFTAVDVAAFLIAVGVVAADSAAGHLNPFLNNFIAVSLACELLGTVTLDSYATAVAISVGLLTYDYFAVFQSQGLADAIASAAATAREGPSQSMMVEVAMKIDGPMKLIFPNFRPPPAYPFSILGLGDIAIPALTASLCLQVDKALQLQGKRPTATPGTRPFFTAAMVGYVAGLGITEFANTVMKSAQPALIYICPSIVLATLACAVLRGELGDLLGYRKPPTEHI